MKIETFIGLPYNKWVSIDNLSYNMQRGDMFKNFRMSKHGFFLEVITDSNGETRVKIKLSNSIEFTV